MAAVTRRAFAASLAPALIAKSSRRPNVVLIITDDQGFGDLSIHGNPRLATPNIDRIGREGVRFTNFHVSPVCSPTRSCLLTGRYNYRTGIVDTYNGRSMMYPDEVTLAEMLRGAGYRTGIFGKWHLGDNYPMRAIDHGFEEALVHHGGGIGQPSDPPGNGYFDPILERNGRPEKGRGYCTDIFTAAALEFMEKHRREPFFCYLAMNAPHDPFQVDEAYAAPFRAKGLDDRTSKVYGMVKNIDENAGRVLGALERLLLDRDTILIFMTDNGPQFARYNAGMRGTKGTPYEGGIRVPFFIRWPGGLQPGETGALAAHIDVTPMLLEACGVPAPAGVRMDGFSVLAHAQRRPVGDSPARQLFIQWMRGDVPEPFGGSAVFLGNLKLVNGRELYDLARDRAEKNDLAASEPATVARLRAMYEAWFKDVGSVRNWEPPRIWIGDPAANPVTLTRQDWRGSSANWLAPEAVGWWELDVRRPGRYQIEVTTDPAPPGSRIEFELNAVRTGKPVGEGVTHVLLPAAELPRGPGRMHAYLAHAGGRIGARYVNVRRY